MLQWLMESASGRSSCCSLPKLWSAMPEPRRNRRQVVAGRDARPRMWYGLAGRRGRAWLAPCCVVDTRAPPPTACQRHCLSRLPLVACPAPCLLCVFFLIESQSQSAKPLAEYSLSFTSQVSQIRRSPKLAIVVVVATPPRTLPAQHYRFRRAVERSRSSGCGPSFAQRSLQ